MCQQREADTFVGTLLTRIHTRIRKNCPSVAATRCDVLKILGFFFPFLLFWFYPCVKTPEKFTDSSPHHKS